MSISNEIERLQNAKASIKTAIENKGVEVGEGLIDTYASKIDEIQIGGGNEGYIALLEGTITDFSNSELKTLRNHCMYNNDNLLTVDLPNVETIGDHAFDDCSKLQSVNIPKIKVLGNNVFYGCSQLKNINTYLELTEGGISLFATCSRLVGDFVLPKLTFMNNYFFSGCQQITSVTAENVTEIGTYVFSNDKNITNISLPKLTKANTYAFNGCTSMTNFDFPLLTSAGNSCFNNCPLIKVFDFPLLSSIGTSCFNNCKALQALILRNQTMCTLANSNAFTNNPISSGTGYIYVPRSLIESYKAGTNWVTYADKFRVIEDYTVDGTVNGEMNWELMGVDI
jgi:hypothetical protein